MAVEREGPSDSQVTHPQHGPSAQGTETVTLQVSPREDASSVAAAAPGAGPLELSCVGAVGVATADSRCNVEATRASLMTTQSDPTPTWPNPSSPSLPLLPQGQWRLRTRLGSPGILPRCRPWFWRSQGWCCRPVPWAEPGPHVTKKHHDSGFLRIISLHPDVTNSEGNTAQVSLI